jgi:hypothetical protein
MQSNILLTGAELVIAVAKELISNTEPRSFYEMQRYILLMGAKLSVALFQENTTYTRSDCTASSCHTVPQSGWWKKLLQKRIKLVGIRNRFHMH